jgi:hypothetical protein
MLTTSNNKSQFNSEVHLEEGVESEVQQVHTHVQL